MRLDASVTTLLAMVSVLRPAFTAPTFKKVRQFALAWLLIPGRHAVTAALVVSGLSGARHHAAWHRIFSHAKWDPDELGRLLFLRLLRLLPEGAPVPAALDDTLAGKKGPKVFGIGTHIDAVRSTRRHRVFAFGHVWVVLAVVVRFPFSRRPWALPVLFRLYRNKQDCERTGHRYWKKTELARQMVDVFAGWLEGRRCELVADQAYCCSTVARRLPENIVLFGSMRPDAALTAPPEPTEQPQRGRPPIRGRRLPTPVAYAEMEDECWRTMEVEMYRQRRKVAYKTIQAQWYRACGGRLLQIVIVALSTGTIPYRVFFCTDPTVTPDYLLGRYSTRWAIEVTFFDLKQFLGFADSQARTRKAVERTAPFVGLLYTVVVMWYAEAGHSSTLALIPRRPWYTHKAGPSFADMLGAAQRAVACSGILDLASNTNNLQNYLTAQPPPGRRAA